MFKILLLILGYIFIIGFYKTFPTCPACNHNTTIKIIDKQLKFNKCSKCGYIWNRIEIK